MGVLTYLNARLNNYHHFAKVYDCLNLKYDRYFNKGRFDQISFLRIDQTKAHF
jgi:hypothetical protein